MHSRDDQLVQAVMRRLLSHIACLVALAVSCPAVAQDVSGVWMVQDTTAKVRIFNCGAGICGTVIWLSEPNDPETGKPQTDRLNPEQQLRMRPILGLTVLYGMQRKGENSWIGPVYNPDDGKSYQGTLELLDANLIRIQGCALNDCGVQIWTRAN